MHKINIGDDVSFKNWTVTWIMLPRRFIRWKASPRPCCFGIKETMLLELGDGYCLCILFVVYLTTLPLCRNV